MDFTLIQDTGKKVRLEWDAIADHGSSGTWYESRDRPVDAFVAALSAFAKPVRSALDLPEEYALEVRSVRIERQREGDKEGEIAGVQVHVMRETAGTNRPTNAHPFIASAEFALVVGLVHDLEQEAEEYFARRKRQQRDVLTEASASMAAALADAKPQAKRGRKPKDASRNGKELGEFDESKIPEAPRQSRLREEEELAGAGAS